MVRRALLLLLPLLPALVAGQANRAPAQAGSEVARPVYVLLYSTIDDPLHMDASEERLQRTLSLLERYRTQYPAAHVSCLYQFSGTLTEALIERNNVTHLIDRIKKAELSGVAEVGYDGTEEPTFVVRPRPNMRRARTGEQRWAARSEAAELFLTEYKDRVTGEPDPERPGGLKKVREVFGGVSSIAGASLELGSDSEIVHQVRRQPFVGIMPGLPEQAAYPARLLEGYKGATKMLAMLVSPDERFAPELFWQDNVLRVSDTSGDAVKVINACDGPEAAQKLLSALDRSRSHVIRVRLGHPSMYLKPTYAGGKYASPLQAVYDIVRGARLPEEGWQPRTETEAAFGREEATVKWLVESFLPANAGSHFTSVADLRRMARTSVGSTVSRDTLAAAAKDLVAQWDKIGNNPPDFAAAGAECFSLADMFQMLATALAGSGPSGTLPDSVRLSPVYGPLEMTEDDGPRTGTVSAAAVASVAAGLAPKLNDAEWKPLPANTVPTWVTVDGVRVNAAQFLRLMAQAYVAAPADGRLHVQTSYMFSGMSEGFPKTRKRADVGATWTLKPAVLVVGGSTGPQN